LKAPTCFGVGREKKLLIFPPEIHISSAEICISGRETCISAEEIPIFPAKTHDLPDEISRELRKTPALRATLNARGFGRNTL